MRNKLRFAVVVCTVVVVFVIALMIAVAVFGGIIVLLRDYISIPHVVCIIIGMLAYIAIMLPVANVLPKLADKLLKKLGL